MGKFWRHALIVAATVMVVAPACTTTPNPSPDRTPPVLHLPDSVAMAAESADGATVTWEATAQDDRDGSVPVVCEPGPGLFPIGDTTVECTAEDKAGNVGSGSFVVTVGEWSEPGPVDTVTIGDETVTVTVDDELSVHVATVDPAELPAIPSAIDSPLGPISIVVDGVTPGSIVPVSVELETPVDLVRKLVDGKWDYFRYDGLTGGRLSPDGTGIELFLQDGGRGDADGQANGRISDPILPANATELTIVTDETPLLTLNEEADFRFRAAGEEGPLTWTVAGGQLAMGLSLDVDGTISGTPWAPSTAPVLIQATDGVTTVRKVFYLMPVSDPTAVPQLTGTALPEGNQIFIVHSGMVPGAIRADGSYQSSSAISSTLLGSMGMSPWVLMDGPEGAQMIDVETGEPVIPDVFPQWTTASFSPNHQLVALREPNADGYRVLDTQTWTTQMEVPSSMGSMAIWSADSDELIVRLSNDSAGTQLMIVSVSNPMSQRTIGVPGLSCYQVVGWSATGRLLMMCSSGGTFNGLVSVNDQNGSDIRVLFEDSCDQDGACSTVDGNSVRPSPSGSHIVAPEIVNGSQRRLVVIPDQDHPAYSPLTEFASGVLVVGKWN